MTTVKGVRTSQGNAQIDYDSLANKPTLGKLAAKDTVEKTDLTLTLRESINKADTALQSYTETDPTVPAWAKAANKPTYTAVEVGAAPKEHTHTATELAAHEHNADDVTSGTLSTDRIPTIPYAKTSGVQAVHIDKTATLNSGSWSSKSQSVSVSGVTSTNTIIVTPAPGSFLAWRDAGVYCSSQGSNSLTFTCETTPTSSLTANIIILN